MHVSPIEDESTRYHDVPEVTGIVSWYAEVAEVITRIVVRNLQGQGEGEGGRGREREGRRRGGRGEREG